MKCFISYFRARVQFFRLSCIPPSIDKPVFKKLMPLLPTAACANILSQIVASWQRPIASGISLSVSVSVFCFSFCFCFCFQSRKLKPDWGTEYLCVRKSQVTREVLSRDGILLNKFENLLIKWIEVRTNIITFVLTHNYSNYVQFNYFTFFRSYGFFPNSLN